MGYCASTCGDGKDHCRAMRLLEHFAGEVLMILFISPVVIEDPAYRAVAWQPFYLLNSNKNCSKLAVIGKLGYDIQTRYWDRSW